MGRADRIGACPSEELAADGVRRAVPDNRPVVGARLAVDAEPRHPLCRRGRPARRGAQRRPRGDRLSGDRSADRVARSEEHTSELQSLMRISYAVFCLKKKNKLNSIIRYI